jgi:Fic family protein
MNNARPICAFITGACRNAKKKHQEAYTKKILTSCYRQRKKNQVEILLIIEVNRPDSTSSGAAWEAVHNKSYWSLDDRYISVH